MYQSAKIAQLGSYAREQCRATLNSRETTHSQGALGVPAECAPALQQIAGAQVAARGVTALARGLVEQVLDGAHLVRERALARHVARAEYDAPHAGGAQRVQAAHARLRVAEAHRGAWLGRVVRLAAVREDAHDVEVAVLTQVLACLLNFIKPTYVRREEPRPPSAMTSGSARPGQRQRAIGRSYARCQ